MSFAEALVATLEKSDQYTAGHSKAVAIYARDIADVSAVEMTRYPPGMIAALEKLRDDVTVVHASSRATAHLWIEAPVARVEPEGRLSWWNRLYDTHPPIEQRIQALREL